MILTISKVDKVEDFATHLIYHYKKVGAARTEKARLRKESKLPNTNETGRDEEGTGSGSETEEHTSKASEDKDDQSQMIKIERMESSSIEKNEVTTADADLESEETNEGGGGDEEGTPKYPYYCDICCNKKIFNRAEYIIRHLRKHAGLEYFCFECGLVG
jgi:hypothetical protein